MAEQQISMSYSAMIYLGAGGRLPLEACRQAAANVWLVEASTTRAQKLRRAASGHSCIRVEETLVAPQSGPQTFYEYNLPWASGLMPPNESLQRLYPGLRCLASESHKGLGIGELVERCLAALPKAGSGQGALLVIDLGEQAGELLHALDEAGQLARFTHVAVMPPHRQQLDLLPPSSLHGPLPLPEPLTWLAEGGRCYQPHPLLSQLQRATEENQQLTRQLEGRTQECDDFWHKSEALTQELDELKRRVEELAQQREEALHQNHLNHEALEAERITVARLREERDTLADQRDTVAEQAEQQRQQLYQEQQQRQQLVEQEMQKAEAQLELVRDILTQGEDF